MFPPIFTNKKYQPPVHKKVPERALVGAGGHISVGKRSRGGKLLPPGHGEVPERARVGQAGTFRRGNVPVEENCCRLGTDRVPIVDGGCWKVPERPRVGIGGHISVGKCSQGGELLPPGHEKGAAAHPGGEPGGTGGNREREPGWGGERRANGNKKGSFREENCLVL